MKRFAVALVMSLALGLGSGCQGRPIADAAAPATAEGFTQMFAAKQDWTWSGGDQATSYRASSGVTYWLFGDTVIGRRDPVTNGYRPGWRMLPNSILRQDGATLTPATDGPAVPNAPDGDRYWPMSMFEANGLIYVFCQRVRTTATFFELRGTELAIFEPRPTGELTFICMRDTPSTGALIGDAAAQAQYGTDAVVEDGMLYVFGFSNQPDDPLCPHRSYVARLPANQVGTASAWRFWGGAEAGWQASMAKAVSILPGQLSSARIVDGIWLLAYKPWNGWGATIYIELRMEITEPAKSTVKIDSPGGPKFVTYLPQLHPEQALTSGNMLLGVSYNGVTLSDVAQDANLYKPRFFDLVLPRFGSAPAA
jgi:hypothetical protein